MQQLLQIFVRNNLQADDDLAVRAAALERTVRITIQRLGIGNNWVITMDR
jgi:hypothetical protein